MQKKENVKGMEMGGKRNDRGEKKYRGKRVSCERSSGGEENKGNYGNLKHKCYTVLRLC